MIKLFGRITPTWDDAPFVARVTTDLERPIHDREQEVLLWHGDSACTATGFRAYLCTGYACAVGCGSFAGPVVHLPASLGYLADGDIVRISPRGGDLWVMYRCSSHHNFIFLTERCNSNCVMCSQPPRDVNDDHLVEQYLRAIPLMSPETPELAITGGEPTLLGDRLIQIIRACKEGLPITSLHMLSNGRMFNYLSFSQELAGVAHPDLMVGIPLYSDIASLHDFVVQAEGAFDQTVRGVMNLRRCGVQVEVRVVLHRQTVHRLPHLARFIARNFPFVDHVAFMGLEMMGYVRMNLEALWIDPVEYQTQLRAAVEELHRHRMTVSIYNHQLCVLDRELWGFARKSISDWKNEYLPECDACAVRDQCGGFFSSSSLRRSESIRPILREETDSRRVGADVSSESSVVN